VDAKPRPPNWSGVNERVGPALLRWGILSGYVLARRGVAASSKLEKIGRVPPDCGELPCLRFFEAMISPPCLIDSGRRWNIPFSSN
jgi:hypothetical protein